MPDAPIDFTALKRNRVPTAPEQLRILGGRIQATELGAWFATWNWPATTWQLTEWVHAISLSDLATPVENLDLLERVRIFGAGGDLDLRRDGDTFYWRFIGDPAMKLPVHLDARDYWSAHLQGGTLYRILRQAVLWGAWDPNLGRWYDDRVGYAKLNYPASLAGTHRVYAHYWEFLDGGQPAFVWIHALSGARAREVDHV